MNTLINFIVSLGTIAVLIVSSLIALGFTMHIAWDIFMVGWSIL